MSSLPKTMIGSVLRGELDSCHLLVEPDGITIGGTSAGVRAEFDSFLSWADLQRDTGRLRCSMEAFLLAVFKANCTEVKAQLAILQAGETVSVDVAIEPEPTPP
jgi:hypothetical protein